MKEQELTCWDCEYHDPNWPESNFCLHAMTQEFEKYLKTISANKVKIDASDCAGFEPQT